MSDIKIEDNFIDQKNFEKIQTLMLGTELDWHYYDGIVYGERGPDGKLSFPRDEDKDKFQFVHICYIGYAPLTPLVKDLDPILAKIKPISILRIKANLLTRTSNIIENLFHVDTRGLPKEKLKQWTTSIFYVNTNNGYTEFEDGTKVESVANRLVSFSGDIKHRGTSCTDEKIRVVINFNYFK